MSKAARKARKQEQRETGQKYQHPTREGVPYGRSPQPSPWATGGSDRIVQDLIQASDAWRDAQHSRPRGFKDGFR